RDAEALDAEGPARVGGEARCDVPRPRHRNLVSIRRVVSEGNAGHEAAPRIAEALLPARAQPSRERIERDVAVAEVQNGKRPRTRACFDFRDGGVKLFESLWHRYRSAIIRSGGHKKENGKNDLHGGKKKTTQEAPLVSWWRRARASRPTGRGACPPCHSLQPFLALPRVCRCPSALPSPASRV